MTRRERRPRSVLQAVRGFAGAYGVTLLAYLGVQALAARMLGTESYGYFVLILTSTSLLGRFGLLGMNRMVLRDVSRLPDPRSEGTEGAEREWQGLRLDILTVTRVVLPGTAVACGIAAGLWRAPEGALLLAAVVTVIVWGAGEQHLWAGLSRGVGALTLANLIEGNSGGALTAVIQAAALLAIYLVMPEAGLITVLSGVAVGYVAVSWLSRFALRHWLSGPRTPESGLMRNVVVVARRGRHFLSNQAATFLNTTVELWLAALLLSPVATSLFGAAYRASQLLLVPNTLMTVVLAPVSSRMIHTDRVELEKILRAGATFSLLVCLVGAIPMVVAPGVVLEALFGVGFADGALALRVLVLGVVVVVALGVAGTVMMMAGMERWSATVRWIVAVVRVVAGVALTLVWGLTGLVLSAVFFNTLISVAMWAITRRRLGLHTHWGLVGLSALRRARG